MTKKHVSLKDLATELGVSISTVSRALKNHPDISPSLAAKIQELAMLRKYSPNPLAMGLLHNKTRIIGVVVPDIVTYFFSSIISGITSYAKEKDYFIIITSSQESYDKEVSSIENLLNMRVDGLIVCLSQDTEDYKHYDKVLEDEVPLVFFDRVCRTQEISSVVADNFQASLGITRHFYQAGFRKIAFIAGPASLNITQERTAGYLAGIRECNLNYGEKYLVQSKLEFEDAQLATRRLLDMEDRPDAIFTVNDTIAFAAMKEIKKRGLRIPEDIGLIAFTDEFHATIVDPELTSVIHPTFEMGQEAARLIINQIDNQTPRAPRQIIMKTQLIVRESSAKKIK